jgi:multiple sugar transport system ATP-binding protein
MAKVLLRSVTKKYGDVVAVDDLNMEVRNQEFFVLVGPSGCGKSTVLRLIAGLEEPTSGEIYIGERLVNRVLPRDRDIAMVFESPTYALYPHLSAYDNMAFSLRVRKENLSPPDPHVELLSERSNRKAREKDIRKRVEDVAGRLGLNDFLGRREKELSAGHRQGVALGRAITRKPQVFLMDDPLSSLDAQARESNRAELRQLHRQTATTTIYVTHDQMEAMALGDRIGVMNEGVLQQVGTPQSLYNHPLTTFVATFMGSPPMNMFQVELRAEDGKTYLWTEDFRVHVPDHYAARLEGYEGRQIIAGLRPEAIYDIRSMADADPETIIMTRVDLREYAGRDAYLHLLAGRHSLVARVSERADIRAGDITEFVLDTESLHAFDPITQRALL